MVNDVADYRRQLTREELVSRIARKNHELNLEYLNVAGVRNYTISRDKDQAELYRRDRCGRKS